MATICLGIPTINRADLLQEALTLYKDTWYGRNVYIVDNGQQQINTTAYWQKIMKMPTNIGVAASWNLMCRQAEYKGYTHIALLNDDVVWRKRASEIEDFIAENPADLYLGIDCNWSVVILPLDTWANVGAFDEGFFPAYFEDNDYQYRMKLKGLNIVHTDFCTPEVYLNSQSIAKDPSLNANFEKNKRRYFQKWGGYQGEEKYKSPFNPHHIDK